MSSKYMLSYKPIQKHLQRVRKIGFLTPRRCYPAKLEYVAPLAPKGKWNRPSEARPQVTAAWDYMNFRVVRGVVVPFILSQSVRGDSVGVVELDSVRFNNGLLASSFDLSN